jgi:6-phospho-beta-glucosidase
LKIAVIGAGSTYMPELVEGLITRRDRLDVTELYLMDIDDEKLEIVGGLAKRMVAAAGMNMRCVLTKSLDEALAGCSYVMAQIRVGRLPARVLDEKIPLKYGLIGQETTGIGGFFKGLRTVPVIVDIAHRMERLCPDAWLINFSNPSGMVAEAVLNNSSIKMIGLCNNAICVYTEVYRNFGTHDLEIQYLGLNHLTWMTGIRQGDRDYLLESLAEGNPAPIDKRIPDAGFGSDCIRMAGGVPCSYLKYYYDRNIHLKNFRNTEKCRGEVCMEIERELLKLYADSELHTKPALLNKRGGSLYSEAANSLIDSLENGKADMHVVNIKNRGALDFMAYDDVVELPALVGAGRVEPIAVKGFANEHIIAMMRTVKAYEKHAVRAALTGDRNEALRAMVIHPIIGDFTTASACFDEMLQAHKEYLPQFFKENSLR